LYIDAKCIDVLIYKYLANKLIEPSQHGAWLTIGNNLFLFGKKMVEYILKLTCSKNIIILRWRLKMYLKPAKN